MNDTEATPAIQIDNEYARQTLSRHYTHFHSIFMFDNNTYLCTKLFDGKIKIDTKCLIDAGSKVNFTGTYTYGIEKLYEEYPFFAFVDINDDTFGNIYVIEKTAVYKYMFSKQIQKDDNNYYLIDRDFIINYKDKIFIEADYVDKNKLSEISGIKVGLFNKLRNLFN